MTSNLHDWLNLLLRWAHFLAGIMWIGTSLYFVWLDSSFEKLSEEKKGVDGECYMVHGGNFYRVEKRRFGAGEMPANLHWFKWEATLTWISGFMLLTVVYYLSGGAYLRDARVSDLSQAQAVGIGLAVIFGGWFVYDFLFRSKLARSTWVNALALALLGALVYFLCHSFSGRGAYIHIGALFGTLMVLNVWVHILPNQRSIINAANAGQEPNYELGKVAKRRSMHNSYMTLPVLFIMISNHFPSTYANAKNYWVLVLMIFLGATLRHFMITLKKWTLVPAGVTLAALFVLTGSPARSQLANSQAAQDSAPVEFYQAYHVIQTRCVQCHSSAPTTFEDIPVAPNGVRFETKEEIYQFAEKIYQRVVVEESMPADNRTQITSAERQLIGRWLTAEGFAK